jgi:hypothetical protein
VAEATTRTVTHTLTDPSLAMTPVEPEWRAARDSNPQPPDP